MLSEVSWCFEPSQPQSRADLLTQQGHPRRNRHHHNQYIFKTFLTSKTISKSDLQTQSKDKYQKKKQEQEHQQEQQQEQQEQQQQ